MINLQPLQKTLSTPGTPGIDTLDPRFQEIAALAEAGDYAKTAEKVAALFQDDIYDIRLLCYYLYAAAEEQGVPGLAEVFSTTSGLLRDSWAAIGPVKKKEVQSQNAIAWFLGKLLQRLKYEEVTKTPAWNAWAGVVTSETIDATLEKSDELRRLLGGTLGDAPKAFDALQKVADWLKSYQNLAAASAPPPPVEEPPPSEAAPQGGGAAPAGGGGQQSAGGGTGSGFPTIEGSVRLSELIARLGAFQTLVERGDLAKAAVVASDVMATMAAFDPRQYFPKLFTPFYAALVPKIEEISQHWNNKETPSWQAMEQLYKLDTEGFASS